MLFVGCEHSDSNGDGSWNAPASSKPAASTVTQSSTTSVSSGTSTSSAGSGQAAASADQVSFGSLNWTFGGVRGAGAKATGVSISGLHLSRDGLSFSYQKDLSAWGYSSSSISGVACLFVQKSNGQWVGGKFDWISSSRRSRDFKNVYSGYEGWSLAGVPNPCQAAFVILSSDCRKRSNVIVGTWSR